MVLWMRFYGTKIGSMTLTRNFKALPPKIAMTKTRKYETSLIGKQKTLTFF